LARATSRRSSRRLAYRSAPISVKVQQWGDGSWVVEAGIGCGAAGQCGSFVPSLPLLGRLSKAAVAQYGGRFLVQGTEPTVAEGEWPSQQRVVIVEFPTMDQLRAWPD
jgi:hypothetical protein